MLNATEFKEAMPQFLDIVEMTNQERNNLEKGIEIAIEVLQAQEIQLVAIANSNPAKRFAVNATKAIITSRIGECYRVLNDCQMANYTNAEYARSKGE
jgi:hypothetical protein